MSLPLAILRPEPGWSASAQAARELGLEVCGAPLFTVEPVEWSVPTGKFDALLIGSANAIRYGGEGLGRLHDLPVHCVGEAMADAARKKGFIVASVGSGGLQRVLDGLAAPLRLLRLAGEERVTLDPPAGVRIDERVVYRTCPRALRPADLPEQCVVALHSAAAARAFCAEIDRLERPRRRYRLCAIGPRVAEAAGQGWDDIAVATTPDDSALLAKAGALCK